MHDKLSDSKTERATASLTCFGASSSCPTRCLEFRLIEALSGSASCAGLLAAGRSTLAFADARKKQQPRFCRSTAKSRKERTVSAHLADDVMPVHPLATPLYCHKGYRSHFPRNFEITKQEAITAHDKNFSIRGAFV